MNRSEDRPELDAAELRALLEIRGRELDELSRPEILDLVTSILT